MGFCKGFQLRVMSKDAHCLQAAWLCQTHAQMGQATGLPNAPETWVAHAIVGTQGFELLDGLPAETEYDFCVWKGVSPTLHPYGACFHDIEERLSTGLIEWLRSRQVHTILVGGLAIDYCVKSTVLQLLRAGDWRVFVNQAACRGIHENSIAQAWQEMQTAGAILIAQAADIPKYL